MKLNPQQAPLYVSISMFVSFSTALFMLTLFEWLYLLYTHLSSENLLPQGLLTFFLLGCISVFWS